MIHFIKFVLSILCFFVTNFVIFISIFVFLFRVHVFFISVMTFLYYNYDFYLLCQFLYLVIFNYD